MIDEINATREEHILTIEDPIEFLHSHKKCMVNQRELGSDAHDASPLALKAALRQDPDVILVGEMRDLETISTALTAAETGHLVFATLHTQTRALDDRPHHRRLPAAPAAAGPRAAVVALQGVMTQTLLPTADGSARVVACEVLVPTPAVRNLIREGKTHQIPSAMQTGCARRHADDGRRAGRRSCAPARSPSASPRRARPRPRSCAACSAPATRHGRVAHGHLRLQGDGPGRREGDRRGRGREQAGRSPTSSRAAA